MNSHRLVSCVGYAWRMSRRLDVPTATSHLCVALQALQQHETRDTSCPATNSRRVISIFEAIMLDADEMMLQTSTNQCSTQEGEAQNSMACRTTATTQTEDAVEEVITRSQFEDIMGNVQNGFETVAEQWQRRIQEQYTVIEELRDRLRLLSAGQEAAVVLSPCERDDDMGKSATGTRATDGDMVGTNMSEAAQVSDLNRLRELHREERMRMKQRRLEERQRLKVEAEDNQNEAP